MFSGAVNPVTGRLEWVQQDRDVLSEDSDISPELRRSQYGDMLHDRQRNRLYFRALEKAVAEVKASGREPHVLDIGTGTGLLALMAAKAGARKVTACEVMRPMVKIAKQVIAQNGFSDVIRVVAKRSTEMSEEDMGGRANILVTEVFDTELIGEGALVTYSHAHKNLLEPGCVVIPSSSRMFVRLISSKFLWSSHKLMSERIPGGLEVPPVWRDCPGPPSVWDLHVEEVKTPEQMQLLSAPIQIAQFPFSDPDLSPSHSTPVVSIPVLADGECHGAVVWWDIDLGGRLLDMDPFNYQHWRDHWLQAVQLFPAPLRVTRGSELSVAFGHDDYSIWLSASKGRRVPAIERPLCVCGVHTACSRTRVSMLNNSARTLTYIDTLTKSLVGKSCVLCLSDCSLLPLLLARAELASLSHLYTVESSRHCRAVITELLEANGLSDAVKVLTKPCSELSLEDLDGRRIEAVVGEPHFSASLLPWHNLHFWYACSSLQPLMAPDCLVVPRQASLMAIAVNFDNLYQLRAPVGTVEGFDLSAFDKAVGKAAIVEEGVEPEPQPLWEYPSYARSAVHTLLTFDLTSCTPDRSSAFTLTGEIQLNEFSKPCHGVVLWMDYQLSTETTTSTGLMEEPGALGRKLVWDPCYKQAVHFLPPHDVSQSLVKLKFSAGFVTFTGQLKTSFTGVH